MELWKDIFREDSIWKFACRLGSLYVCALVVKKSSTQRNLSSNKAVLVVGVTFSEFSWFGFFFFPFHPCGNYIIIWCWLACMHANLLQSYLTLCDPMDYSPPGLLSMGSSRQEYWSGLDVGLPASNNLLEVNEISTSCG